MSHKASYQPLLAAGALLLIVTSLALMRRIARGAGFVILFVAVFLAAMFGASRKAKAQDVLIEQVTLIDGTSSAPTTSKRIDRSRQDSASHSPQRDAPAGPSERIDGNGKFLVPGFHRHPRPRGLGTGGNVKKNGQQVLGTQHDPEISMASLRTLLAFGITTLRDPGGPASVLVDMRERQQRGELVGPRMVVAGEVIDRLPMAGLTTQVKSPEDVRKEIKRQAQTGVDWIKLYTSLEPQWIAAGVEEAGLHGLRVAAHLERTSWTEAARLGVDSLLHIVPGSPELLPPDKRAALQESLPGTHRSYRWFELVDPDSPEIRELVKVLVENQTAVDPTMVTFESIFLAGESRREKLPGLEYAPPRSARELALLLSLQHRLERRALRAFTRGVAPKPRLLVSVAQLRRSAHHRDGRQQPVDRARRELSPRTRDLLRSGHPRD